MKAIILLGTLKKQGQSNTAVLSEFFAKQLMAKNVEVETIKLVDYNILPGTYADMGSGDQWPEIFEKILAADILVFSTPVWWNSHSSEMQKVVERLDVIHDEIMTGKLSRLDGKTAGVIITGDSDGAEHIIASMGNFFNAVGLIMPPYCSLSVLWEGQAKDRNTSKEELLKKYESDYKSTADKMADQLVKFL